MRSERYPGCSVVCLLSLLALIVVCSVGHAEGDMEVSGIQRAFLGESYAGTVYSLRIGCAKLPSPVPLISTGMKVDFFADAGATFSETAETKFLSGLVGASIGFRGDTFRIGAGCRLPEPAPSAYLRCVLLRF